jgi:hypothetical protein
VLVKKYSLDLIDTFKKDELDEKTRQDWIHISHMVDIIKIDEIMTK